MNRPVWLASICCLLVGNVLGQAVDLPEPGDPLAYLDQSPTYNAIEPPALPGNVAVLEEPASLEPELPQVDANGAALPADDVPIENSPMPRRFRYALNLELRGVYDDNVTLASDGRERQSDYSGQLSVGIVLGLGDVLERGGNFLAVNYTPTGYLYVNNSDLNTLEHVGSLQAQWRLGRFTFNLSQDLSSVQSSNLGVTNGDGGFNNQANLDLGGRRRITTYATSLFASAALTGKTSLRFGATYSISDPEEAISSDTLSGTVGLDYSYGPKLGLGLDFVLGQQFVDEPSPDSTFEQINLRANYELTGKLSTNASVGIEFRQSEDGTQDNVTPIFQIGLSYKPFDGTDVTLSANRRTQNSASAFGQDFTSTQVVLSLRQRFFQRLHVTLTTGYQSQSYFSTVSGAQTDRDDNYLFVVPGIDVRIMESWSAGVFYSYRRNDSSLESFSFDDNQFGLRSNFTF